MKADLIPLRSLVISIVWYACESWTLNNKSLKKLNKRILVGLFKKNSCYIRLLQVHYTTHKTNMESRRIVVEHIWKNGRPVDGVDTTLQDKVE